MERALVSIVTPMYNTAGYIYRLLDSVLFQTYPNIEMIIIDDGSTDNSCQVVKSYIPKFEKRGYSLKYDYQENSGQSVAIKNALQHVKGKYLVWPDSDDYYANKTAIEEMVDKLQNAPKEFKIVRTLNNVLEDISFKLLYVNGTNSKEYENSSLFYDCLYAKNFFFCSGAYMVDVDVLYRTTNFDIYTDKNAGQNWQLLLPVLYKYRCITILKPLYNVVSRTASHSRGQFKGYKAIEAKLTSYFLTQTETLNRISEMSNEEKEIHKKNLLIHYKRILLRTAILEKRKDKVLENKNFLFDETALTQFETIVVFIICNMDLPYLGNIVYRVLSKLKRTINIK